MATNFAKKKQKLLQKARKLEEQTTERPWQFKGEASAKDRGDDALVDFDLEASIRVTSRPDTSLYPSFEATLLNKVKDKNFSDISTKTVGLKKTEDVQNAMETEVHDLPTKIRSLNEVIEDDYRAAMKIVTEPQAIPKHEALRKDLLGLLHQLDLLSSFHYKPPPPTTKATELSSQMPALMLEEVGAGAHSQSLSQVSDDAKAIAQLLRKPLSSKAELSKAQKRRMVKKAKKKHGMKLARQSAKGDVGAALKQAEKSTKVTVLR